MKLYVRPRLHNSYVAGKSSLQRSLIFEKYRNSFPAASQYYSPNSENKCEKMKKGISLVLEVSYWENFVIYKFNNVRFVKRVNWASSVYISPHVYMYIMTLVTRWIDIYFFHWTYILIFVGKLDVSFKVCLHEQEGLLTVLGRCLAVWN